MKLLNSIALEVGGWVYLNYEEVKGEGKWVCGLEEGRVDMSQSEKVGGKVRKQDNSKECGEGKGEI